MELYPPRRMVTRPNDPTFGSGEEHFLWEPLSWFGLVKPWIFYRGEVESISDVRLTPLGAQILPTLLSTAAPVPSETLIARQSPASW